MANYTTAEHHIKWLESQIATLTRERDEARAVLRAVGEWVEQRRNVQVLFNDGVQPSDAMVDELDRRANVMIAAFNAARGWKDEQ